ncbi:hypothetical protein HT102_15090 [Hoyosella sp. G463]|uniref:Lipoprotein n=1 Tax=Lolliginicoccus lacisalsi TaxID=2742202 RepID=A0A927PMC3_9ACTN|nr:hypothetical protein [Lolliginicoccus lacisalsi]
MAIVTASGVGIGAVASCTVGLDDDGSPAGIVQPEAQPDESDPGRSLPVVVDDAEGGLALGTTQQFFARAPFVVTAPVGDGAALVRAASLAVATSVPMLPIDPADGSAVLEEIERLGAGSVLAVGEMPDLGTVSVIQAPAGRADLEEMIGRGLDERDVPGTADSLDAIAAIDGEDATLLSLAGEPLPEPGPAAGADALPEFGRAELDPPVLALIAGPASEDGQAWAEHIAAAATARAAGATVVPLAVPDPRATAGSVSAIRDNEDATVVALGSAFGTVPELRERVRAAVSVPELPGGGQLVYPGRRMIALYGHPGVPAMGLLGEQPVDEAIARAVELAEQYQPFSAEPVIPAFELIVTVASVSAGADGNYSNIAEVEMVRPWIEAAAEAGVYVVLDLQPGRTDFLTQARMFEDLLREPHVGLALDPEWRLKPGEMHLRQIGQVDAAEVNEVTDWLADLTARHDLPQKVLILHQFQQRMITDRESLDTSREEVAVLIHADGHGVPGEKMSTWEALKTGLPDGVWLGWKNFIDEDFPTFTPERTMLVDPAPWFVSYQ